MLSSKHKATIPKALENYDKIVAKYTDAEPMTGRLSRPCLLYTSDAADE